jgi:hypothetical protein
LSFSVGQASEKDLKNVVVLSDAGVPDETVGLPEGVKLLRVVNDEFDVQFPVSMFTTDKTHEAGTIGPNYKFVSVHGSSLPAFIGLSSLPIKSQTPPPDKLNGGVQTTNTIPTLFAHEGSAMRLLRRG